ncbi:restriction endonuclease [Stetteria hydrogenophila]
MPTENSYISEVKVLIDKLIDLARNGGEPERLASLSTLLFLYHENCQPTPDEVKGFDLSLRRLVGVTLGFHESAISVLDECRSILYGLSRKMAMISFENRDLVAAGLKKRIDEALKEVAGAVSELHLKRIAGRVAGLGRREKDILFRLRDSLAYASKLDPRVYGFYELGVDVHPLEKHFLERMFPPKRKSLLDSFTTSPTLDLYLRIQRYGMSMEDVTRLLESVGVALTWGFSTREHSYKSLLVLPAFFADKFSGILVSPELEVLEKLLSEMRTREVGGLDYKGKAPSRELLGDMAARALKIMGFRVWTNTRRAARSGDPVEVDVWAEKDAGGSRFRVYVSCENWNKDVDKPIVDEEFSRAFSLQEVPHLRILVIKSLTKQAREAAEAYGFHVIELGRKADKADAVGIYDTIYTGLAKLLKCIAPPQLVKVARSAGGLSSELERLLSDLKRALKNYWAELETYGFC